MGILNLAFFTFSIVRFKCKTEDFPYSKVWLLLLMLFIFCLKNVSNLTFVAVMSRAELNPHPPFIQLSLYTSSIITIVSMALPLAFVYSVLVYFNKLNRWVQILEAIFAADCFFAVMTLMWVGVLSLQQLPLPAEGTLIAWLLVLSFIGMLYWQFVVIVHIFANGFSVNLLYAGIFALIYMLIQHNVVEFLLRAIVHLG